MDFELLPNSVITLATKWNVKNFLKQVDKISQVLVYILVFIIFLYPYELLTRS